MDSHLDEALAELRVLHKAVQRVRIDRCLHIRAHNDGRQREATLRDQRDRLIMALVENPTYGMTQADVGRALGLSRQRIRQIIVRIRRKLVYQERSPHDADNAR